MDRKIDDAEIRRKRRNKYVKFMLIGLIAVAALFGFRKLLRTKAETNKMRIEAVQKGDIKNTVTATGLVVAAFEEQVNAPVATTIQQILLPTGTEVKANDVVLTLDREYVQLQLNGRRDQLALKQNNVDLLKLEYDRDIQELDYNTRIKALELSTAEAQLADAKRLLAVGGATDEEVEQAQLQVQITQLEKEKLSNELSYRRNSLNGRRRNLELEVGMEEKEVAQLSRKLRETEVRAPRAGVVTWVNENIGQQVAEGAPLVRIADLGRFRLEGSCSDRYAGQVDVGLPVDIRVGKERLKGTISTILPEVENNTLRFLVEFADPSHDALRPNLRTEFGIIVGEKPNVLRLKNGPAFRGGLRQELFVVSADGTRAERRDVGLGMRNGDWVEITSGLQAGEKVIISDTKEYEHLEEFVLE
ncbi:HlyD family secretion protein [Lewinellaceae bacterium SD302]|nr:HlyD family secretion protein [Lewinellaceae bacterium SD302]